MGEHRDYSIPYKTRWVLSKNQFLLIIRGVRDIFRDCFVDHGFYDQEKGYVRIPSNAVYFKPCLWTAGSKPWFIPVRLTFVCSLGLIFGHLTQIVSIFNSDIFVLVVLLMAEVICKLGLCFLVIMKNGLYLSFIYSLWFFPSSVNFYTPQLFRVMVWKTNLTV